MFSTETPFSVARYVYFLSRILVMYVKKSSGSFIMEMSSGDRRISSCVMVGTVGCSSVPKRSPPPNSATTHSKKSEGGRSAAKTLPSEKVRSGFQEAGIGNGVPSVLERVQLRRSSTVFPTTDERESRYTRKDGGWTVHASGRPS